MTATRTARIVTGPQGTIRVYVPGADDAEGRKLARNAACAAHGGVAIGKTPAPVKASRGTTYTFTPVTVTPKAAPKARKAAPKAAPAVDRIAELERELAALKAAPKAPKAPRVIPAPVAARMAATAAGKAACATCHGHGTVRKAGPKAGQAYRTADGAKAATANGNSVPCPVKHKRAA